MDRPLTRECPPIIFIGGTGRCGTSITRVLLDKHPLVASLPFEYRFIIDPDGIVDFYCSYTATWSPYLADRKLKRLERFLNTLAHEPPLHRLLGRILRRLDPKSRHLSPRQYHGWHLDDYLPGFEEARQELFDELVEFRFSAYWHGTESYARAPQITHAGPLSRSELAPILNRFVCTVVAKFLQKQEAQFFVEDNTWNTLFAPELLDLVPQARILHIYRDPRDVVASFVQQRWCPDDVTQAALWYRSLMRRWLTIRSQLPADSYYEFSLERLVNQTESALSEICDFTGLPYDPVMLETDLSRSHSGRWRTDLSAREQQCVSEMLGDLIHEFGYE